MQKYADLRRRVDRLGYSKDEVTTIFTRAQAKKPTRETLQRIRSAAEGRAALALPAPNLPNTKTILRAYVDLQKSKVHRIYIISTGLLQLWKLGDKLALARHLKKVAERDFFFAKEKRLAQVGRALRPVIWLVRVAMPREARRLDQAIIRCTRLAYQQELRRAGREAIQKAYERWRQEFIQKPIAQLKQESTALARPAQQAERSRLETAQARIPVPDINAATAVFLRGYQSLASLPGETKTIASVSAWLGKEGELVTQVLHHSKGTPTSLTKEQYDAAVRIGRVGNLLTAADGVPAIKVPSRLGTGAGRHRAPIVAPAELRAAASPHHFQSSVHLPRRHARSPRECA